MVWVQKWPFFNLFFMHIGQENVFMIFQNEKTPFQAITRRSSNSRKIAIFPNGLPMVLVQKWPFSQFFFFQVIQVRKVSFMIFYNEKTPVQAIKTRRSKSRNIDICPKGLTHGFGSKMAILPGFFFQAIQARKMSFIIFQNEKTPFQSIKTRRSKIPKIDIFVKGLTHGLGPKMAIFQPFFNAIQPGKCLYDILERENAFLGFKNKKFKKSKN